MIRQLFLLIAVMLAMSCSTQHVQPGKSLTTPLDPLASWRVLPFSNHSQTPLAGERVAALVLSAVRARGLPSIEPVVIPTGDLAELPLLDDGARFNKALEIARSQEVAYAVTGSVEEWRYKAGLDGEPAVGLSLRVVEIASGDTLWTSSAARSGWSRESLTGNGQKVIGKLVNEMFAKSLWDRSKQTP